MEPTQCAYPWRTTVRTIFQALVGLAALLTLITVDAGTPAAVATAVAVSATITRVMAIPAVDDWIARFVPFLASEPGGGWR